VVEQRPFKPKVVGSIPTAPTKALSREAFTESVAPVQRVGAKSTSQHAICERINGPMLRIANRMGVTP
jgi:hypothetical protein